MTKRKGSGFSETGFYAGAVPTHDDFSVTQSNLEAEALEARKVIGRKPEIALLRPEHLQEYLKSKELTPEEIADFTFWFNKNVNTQIGRQQDSLSRGASIEDVKSEEEIEEEVLKELAEKVKAHKIAKEQAETEEGERRLIPFLLTKSGAKAKIEASLKGLEAKNNGKTQTVLVVANMDIDGLKAINDTHGHLVGDMALKFFGTKLNDSLRPGSNADGIHYSGDEFGITMEMTYDADLSQEEVNRRVSKRLVSIIAQTTSPIIYRGKKPVEDIIKEEESVLRLYGKSGDITNEERNKILEKHRKNLKKVTGENSQQEVSVGFVIARAEDNLSYEDVQDQADIGANLSKLIPYIELARASNLGKEVQKFSPDKRIVHANNGEALEEKYTKDEIETAKLIRSLNRTTNELAPDISSNISEHVKSWFSETFNEELNIDLLSVRLMLASPRILKKFSEAKTDEEQKRILQTMIQIERIHGQLE